MNWAQSSQETSHSIFHTLPRKTSALALSVRIRNKKMRNHFQSAKHRVGSQLKVFEHCYQSKMMDGENQMITTSDCGVEFNASYLQFGGGRNLYSLNDNIWSTDTFWQWHFLKSFSIIQYQASGLCSRALYICHIKYSPNIRPKGENHFKLEQQIGLTQENYAFNLKNKYLAFTRESSHLPI